MTSYRRRARARAAQEATPAPLELLGLADDRGAGLVRHGRLGERPVLVRRLTVDPGPAAARALLVARTLEGVAGAGLAEVLAVVDRWEAIDVVIDAGAVVGSLAAVHQRRRLQRGEAVGVGLRLGQALETLHGAGGTHGRLSASDVLLGPDGHAVLTGYGIAAVLGSAGSPAADVADLVELLRLTGPSADRAWTSALDCAGRQGRGLGGLLAELRTLGAGTPVGSGATDAPVSEAVATPVPPLSRRAAHRAHRKPRRASRSVVLPAAGAVLVLAGWLGARAATDPGPGRAAVAEPIMPGALPAPTVSSAPPAVTSSARPTHPTDWRNVLGALDAARARAFAAPGGADPAAVDAPGSSAWAYDAQAVRALRSRAARVDGLTVTTASLTVVSTGTDRTDLQVVDTVSAHAIVAADGTVLERRAATGPRRSLVSLVRTAAGWRVADVRGA